MNRSAARAPAFGRLIFLTTFLLGASLPLAAQQGGHDADRAVAGGGTAPAGWSIRADAKGNPAHVRVLQTESGLHLILGPAIILYQESTGGTGPFHTLATFTQAKQLPHAEGYGLFIGGRDLKGPGQAYTYFLVREDGSYLIKRREGEKTDEITRGWVQHAAVHRLDAKGTATNLLEIDGKRDPAKIVFQVNGETVFTAAAGSIQADGIVGVRANHHLDLLVDGFAVHR
jgi:hypothetical protein